MPGYKTHLAGAAVLTASALYGVHHFGVYPLEPLQAAGLMAVALLATLFPDTDTASKGRPIFYGLMAFTDLVLLVNKHYQLAALLGLFAMLPAVGSHRGWTHTWWAALLVPAPLLVVPELLLERPWQDFAPYYLAAVFGYFAHLILDREW